MTYVLVFLMIVGGELLPLAAMMPSLEICNAAVNKLAEIDEDATAICVAVKPKDAT